jgi:hypothetical protein
MSIFIQDSEKEIIITDNNTKVYSNKQKLQKPKQKLQKKRKVFIQKHNRNKTKTFPMKDMKHNQRSKISNNSKKKKI